MRDVSGELEKTQWATVVLRWHVLLLVILVLVGPPEGRCAVWLVNSGQTNRPADGRSWAMAFQTVSEATSAAVYGDEVWVAEGRYLPFEPGVFSTVPPQSIEIPTGVSVFGGFAGTESNRAQRDHAGHPTVISAYGEDKYARLNSPRLPLVAFSANADRQTRLDGFRLEQNSANYGSAVHVRGGSPIVANNTIVSNRADGVLGGSAVFVERTATLQSIGALEFFNRVAGRLFSADNRAGSDGRLITHTNIMLWPTNDYDPAVHRVLQVAANMYDATRVDNHQGPQLPTVFRPFLRRETVDGQSRIYIAGFELQDTGVDPQSFVDGSNYWDLSNPEVRDLVPLVPNRSGLQPMAIGQPLVIGARKGLPNFNELAVRTEVRVRRDLLLSRPNSWSLPNQTNQYYILSISNIFGVEVWNSYQAAYLRPLELAVEVDFVSTLQNRTNEVIYPEILLNPFASFQTYRNYMVIDPDSWSGKGFQIPILGNHAFLTNSVWSPADPFFHPVPSNYVPAALPAITGFPTPEWFLNITNRVRYVVTDNGRVIDYVNNCGLIWQMDIVRELQGDESEARLPWNVGQSGVLWNTTRQGESATVFAPTLGVGLQLLVSSGEQISGAGIWNFVPGVNTKEKAIDAFRVFAGLPPIRYHPNQLPPMGTNMLAPFSPARLLVKNLKYEVNDPLVHYTRLDIDDPARAGTNTVERYPIATKFPDSPPSLGVINSRYAPWAHSFDFPDASNPSFVDPILTGPAMWNFPSGRDLNLFWLDRVHRGTPWQTIYFGDDYLRRDSWKRERGSEHTFPSEDHKWIQEFQHDWLGLPVAEPDPPSPVLAHNTIAFNASSAEGSGAAIHLEPSTAAVLINNIVAFNTAGVRQVGEGFPLLISNAVHGNTNGNYLGLDPGYFDLDLDPQFRNAPSGDFTLSTTSPLVDSAHQVAWKAGWLMRDELDRLENHRLDFGASELPVDLAPRLKIEAGANHGGTILKVFGYPGLSYELEASPDFDRWQRVDEVVTAAGVGEKSIDPSERRLFFRVHRPVIR